MNEDALYLVLVPLMLNNPVLPEHGGTQLLRGTQLQRVCALGSALPSTTLRASDLLEFLILW